MSDRLDEMKIAIVNSSGDIVNGKLAPHSKAALQSFIEEEVIGKNSHHAEYCDLSRQWENMEDVGCSCDAEPQNELRSEQRQALRATTTKEKK